MKKLIGERIRKIRQRKDYTQDNMAAELEITAGAYAKIERGETDPSITRLLKIAEILQVNIMAFLQDSPEPYDIDPKHGVDHSLHNTVEKLSQEIRSLSRELDKLKSDMAHPKKISRSKK